MAVVIDELNAELTDGARGEAPREREAQPQAQRDPTPPLDEQLRRAQARAQRLAAD